MMADGNAWIGLVDETREALGHLRADELEALALRAQQALDAGASHLPSSGDLRELAAKHRILGDVLRETERNIAVLRRLRSRNGEEPWAL
jgi:hypothetical protein